MTGRYKKKIRRNLLELGFVGILAIALECFVFNFDYVRSLMDTSKTYNVRYTLEDFEKVNWTAENNLLISAPDPQMILNSVDMETDSVLITFSIDAGVLPAITLFYSNENVPVINGELMAQSTKINPGGTEIKIGDYINTLRIDMGEEPGLVLRDMQILINPAVSRFSLSRIVAVLFIYLIAKGLFAMQAPVDYKLE